MKILKKIDTPDELAELAASLRKTGKKTLAAAGCGVYVTEGGSGSSGALNRFLGLYPPQTARYLAGMRRKYSAERIIGELRRLRKLRVLVIGDGIVDEYHYCESMGRSAKEPLVVQRFLDHEVFAGGAFAAANHVAGLCGKVTLFSALGDKNDREGFIRSRLRPNVTPRFFTRAGSETIVKRRFVEKYSGAKLFEICYMNKGLISQREEARVLARLEAELPRHDMVLALDFGHGLFTKKIISLLQRKARFLAVNVQTNSANSGFNMITKYDRVDFASITESEARLACHDEHSGMEEVIKNLCPRIGASAMILTRGKLGSMGYAPATGFVHTPAVALRVVDRVGAGDALFSFASPCMAAGLPLDMASFVGNVAGAIAVQIVCNKEPVGTDELFELVSSLLG